MPSAEVRGHDHARDGGSGRHRAQISFFFKARKKRHTYICLSIYFEYYTCCKLLLPPDKFCSECYFSWFFMYSKLFTFSFTWVFLPSRILTDNFSQSALFHLFSVMLSWIIKSHRDSRKVHFKDNISYLLSHEKKKAQTFKSLLNVFNSKNFKTALLHVA